jgi:hypothetical protein
VGAASDGGAGNKAIRPTNTRNSIDSYVLIH